jgi:hypothetical protein
MRRKLPPLYRGWPGISQRGINIVKVQTALSVLKIPKSTFSCMTVLANVGVTGSPDLQSDNCELIPKIAFFASFTRAEGESGLRGVGQNFLLTPELLRKQQIQTKQQLPDNLR